MKKIYDLLARIRPTTNAAGLNAAARLPKNTLGKHYRWEDGKPDGRPILPEHVPNLIRELCRQHGCTELDGWQITCDPEGPAIFASRRIPGRPAEIIEVEPGAFEYLQPEWRQVYDEVDFAYHFCAE